MRYVPKGALCAAQTDDGKPCLNPHYKRSKYCLEHQDQRGGAHGKYPECGSLDLAQAVLNYEPIPQRLQPAEPVKAAKPHVRRTRTARAGTDAGLKAMADLQLVYNHYHIFDEAFVHNEFATPFLFANPRVGVNYKFDWGR